MTDIDIEKIKEGIGTVIQAYVGDYLAEEGPEGNKSPAVFFARPDAPYTNYPFAIIDFDGAADPDGWILSRRVNDSGAIEYAMTYNLSFSIQIFDQGRGNPKSKASTIAMKLRSYFNSLPATSKILKEVGGATLEDVFSVNDFSSKTKQGYLDVYGFNITVVDTQVVVEPDPDYINSLILDLELKRHKQDSNPLTSRIVSP